MWFASVVTVWLPLSGTFTQRLISGPVPSTGHIFASSPAAFQFMLSWSPIRFVTVGTTLNEMGTTGVGGGGCARVAVAVGVKAICVLLGFATSGVAASLGVGPVSSGMSVAIGSLSVGNPT